MKTSAHAMACASMKSAHREKNRPYTSAMACTLPARQAIVMIKLACLINLEESLTSVIKVDKGCLESPGHERAHLHAGTYFLAALSEKIKTKHTKG